MMINQELSSDLAIPPGEYLLEVLEELDMSQQELAKRTGRPAQAICEIVKGSKAITPDTAIQFEKVLGVSARVWTSLEAEYQLAKAREQERADVEKEIFVLDNYPYADLKKLNLVSNTRDKATKVDQLRSFLGVSSLSNLDALNQYNPAFRLANECNVQHESITCWLRAGSIFSRDVQTATFSKKSLKDVLPLVKSLTLEDEPTVFLEKLRRYLASSGVALVTIPHFKKTYVTGATFWDKKDKAVIMMSLRGSWGDIFWFSLFHEMGHILLHDKRTTFIENSKRGSSDLEEQEREADSFARDYLIPPESYKEFIKSSAYDANSIRDFSNEIDIHPGIVTGRLQHDKHIDFTKHPHRVRYKWQ